MRAEPFTITGHRGAAAVEPENTMRAFRRAVELGVDALELDVHLSSDGHLIVMHDKTVDRTTNGSGAIGETTFADIRSLDAGKGERVPEFGEVWREFREIGLQVEVKDAKATSAVLELIRSDPRPGATMITSFLPDVVAQAIAEDGPWTVGLIGGVKDAEKITSHIDFGMDMLLVNWAIVDVPAVQQYRSSGKPADVWPCRTPEDVRRAIEEGWNGTTVDDPQMALDVRAELMG